MRIKEQTAMLAAFEALGITPEIKWRTHEGQKEQVIVLENDKATVVYRRRRGNTIGPEIIKKG